MITGKLYLLNYAANKKMYSGVLIAFNHLFYITLNF
jgi:hypothetical protein